MDNEQPTPPPVGSRDPQDRKTLEDAFRIARGIIDRTNETKATDADDFWLASGFLILCQDLAGYWEAVTKQRHYCGWCERAGISRADLPSMTLDEAAEHTLMCEHNPLVRELADQRAENARLMSILGKSMSPGIAESLAHLERMEPLRTVLRSWDWAQLLADGRIPDEAVPMVLRGFAAVERAENEARKERTDA